MAEHAGRIRRTLIAGVLVTLGAISVCIVIFAVTTAWRRLASHHDPEFQWFRRAQYSLDGMKDALNCFESRNGTLPNDSSDLLRSGCLIAGTSFEPSFVGILDLPLSNHPDWDRIDQIVIRRRTGAAVAPDAVVAVVLPDKRFPTKCLILLHDGSINYITQSEWDADREVWRHRLGGADLWP